MKLSTLLPAALVVGSLAYGAGAIAGTYGGTFGNGGTPGAAGGGSGDITSVGDCLSGACLASGTTTMDGAAIFRGTSDTDTNVAIRNANAGTGTSAGVYLQNGTGSAYFVLYGTGVADNAYAGANDAIFGSTLGRTSIYTATTEPVEIWINNTVQAAQILSTEFVVNQAGASYDFRVEGDTNANLLVVDGSADAVGIGDSTPDALLDVGGTFRVDGQATFVLDPSSTSASSASVYVNPATSASNEVLLACADNGTSVFSVDKEGDVDLRTVANSASGTCFTGQTGVVCVTDNMAVSPTSGGGVIAFRNNATGDVEGLTFYDNSLTNLGGPRYYGSTVADADFADKMAWVSVGKMISMLRTDAAAAGTVIFEIRDDALSTGAQLFSVDGSGNLFVNAAGTRTKGTITLAAGTGTATVASGSVCVCSDTTAVNAVQCSVTTTTLTANGTGTDVIAYHCL